VYGTRRSANVQNLTSVIKVSAVVLMSVALLAAGRAAPDATAAPIEAPASLFTAAGIALLGVLWAYEGWQYSTFSAGETTRPQRTFPLGITIGMIVLIGVYCLANVAYVAALGPENAAASDRIAATAVNAAFGPTAARLITIAILISIYSAANSLALTAPRVFYAMAGDGLFFKQLARVSPRFGTPAISIVALCAWAMVLSLSGTFEQLLTYVVFTGWLFYALGAASIFVYRTRQPDAPRPFRVPGYPLTPALFVIAGCAIVVNALFARTEPALTGIAIVLTGAPAYMIWRYLLRRTPPSAERPTETVAAGDSGRRAGH
jgi:APA family basic amino acid/polyamine antiporter